MDTRFIDNDLHDNDWVGVVINNQDPTFSGRAKVRVLGVMDGIIDEHIPWATPITGDLYGLDGAGMMSVPKIGAWVRIQFNNGDLYAPEIRAIQNLDTDLIDKIRDDYDGAHVILHDPLENLSIIFLRTSGLMIFYKESFFQITPDSMITLQHADGDSIIQMEGDKINIASKNEVNITAAGKATVNADEVVIGGNQRTKIGPGPTYKHAVLAEPMWSLMMQMATALDGKLPPTPGLNIGLVTEAMQAATSVNVLLGT